jgi:hypothetical protein
MQNEKVSERALAGEAKYSEKPPSVSFCTPQIPHDLTRDGIRITAADTSGA